MSTRVDSWIWAIRLTKTRSAAGAACRAGHVQVNGVTAKPATPVSVGDEVRVRLHGRERIVEVVRLIAKRVSAPLAAECYIDNSPPPPPREVLASQPRRDPGAGRPTKRERRQLEKFRGGTFLILLSAVLLVLAGCSSDDDAGLDPDDGQPAAPGEAGEGPLFVDCGGVTAEEVSELAGFPPLTQTVDNPSGCQWDSDPVFGGGPHASFSWYRGSPVDRERALIQLSRDSVKDLEILGYQGFIGVTDTQVGYGGATVVCELGMSFGADFFLWSLASGGTPDQPAPDATRICDATERLAELVIERSA